MKRDACCEMKCRVWQKTTNGSPEYLQMMSTSFMGVKSYTLFSQPVLLNLSKKENQIETAEFMYPNDLT